MKKNIALENQKRIFDLKIKPFPEKVEQIKTEANIKDLI